ncbi:hypothetical protein AB00_2609 [Raoultella ornithinolytica 2-156-04_S1_C1]|nr:hypothetical protein AB00_2609 [Raoultella ornithinolytica 2-156-04_S1_C1]
MSFCILNPCFHMIIIALLNQQTAEKQLLKEKVVPVSVFVKILCKIDRLAFLQANGVSA